VDKNMKWSRSFSYLMPTANVCNFGSISSNGF